MHLEGQLEWRDPPRRLSLRSDRDGELGYAMAALLVAIAVMGVFWTMAVPVWKHAVQREKEEELIFRAGQYARAVALYQRRYANAFPPNVDVLLKERYLRKRYKDPITGGDFRVLSPLELQTAGAGGLTTSPRPGMPGLGTQQRPGLPSGGQSPGGGLGGGPSGGLSGPGPGGRGQPGQPGLAAPGQPFGSGREVTAGVAAVVSRSTATSIRIFKNRQQYSQWIVTVEDVTPRRGLQQPQPGQPGQPGSGSQPGRAPGFPGATSPGLGGPATQRPPG